MANWRRTSRWFFSGARHRRTVRRCSRATLPGRRQRCYCVESLETRALLGVTPLTVTGTLFSAAVTRSSGGTSPSAVVVADFNGDGRNDLAVANADSGTVGVLLANGLGGFAAAATFSSGGSSLSALAVGDFNNDGHADLAVTNSVNGTVGVLLGNGLGGFAAAEVYSTWGSCPTSITVGDFDGDGYSDLAVANSASNVVAVLWNDGAGRFAANSTFNSAGAYPTAITAGDFDSDGCVDLAVANSGSNTVAILWGDGWGDFTASSPFDSGGYYPVSVTVDDFNSDGQPDLAVANSDSGTVGILLGDGLGNFATAVAFSSGGVSPKCVTVGDFDGDGQTDLAVANSWDGTVGVLLGDGLGDFATTGPFSTGGTAPAAVAVGDFNADGQADLAVANAGSPSLGVLTNTLSPTLASVSGRYVFYNNSYFDTSTTQNPTFNDDTAIATDKQALLPGQTAALKNYTSYSRGLNGLMVDIAGLANAGSLNAADFLFKAGNDSSPAAWATLATAPAVTVRTGAGTGGSDRVTLIWADAAAVKGKWLQVTVNADANTGLAQDDVFYFGNAVGECGNSTANFVTDTFDITLTRTHRSVVPGSALITNVYDFNRDGKCDTTDISICRVSRTTVPTALQKISPPVAKGKASIAGSAKSAVLDAPLAPALDAVLAGQSAPSDTPVKAAWFWDFGQLDSATRRDKKDRSELKAIDAILAGY